MVKMKAAHYICRIDQKLSFKPEGHVLHTKKIRKTKYMYIKRIWELKKLET